MITLQEAQDIAERWTQENVKVPSANSLHSWKSRGLITPVIEYREEGSKGGRVGLYHETLPVQVAVVAELKKKFKLTEIKQIVYEIYDPTSPDYNNDIKREIDLFVETQTIIDTIDKAMEEMDNADDREELKKAEQNLDKSWTRLKKRMRLNVLLNNYEEKWKKYQELLEEEM